MIQLGQAEARAQLVRAAVAQALEPLPVRAVQVVLHVVGDLGGDPGRGLLLAHLEAGLTEDPLESRDRRLELHERAQRVEQNGAELGHAIQCQVAYCAVNKPSPTANAPITRSVIRRSSHASASHMKIGNS